MKGSSVIAMPAAIDVPLRMDDGGVIRIGDTRVTLQAVVADYHRGSSSEEIAYHYPALKLSEVYFVIGYYLQNRAEVDAYVQQQRQLAGDARQAYEADQPNDPLRDRLLARLQEKRNQSFS